MIATLAPRESPSLLAAWGLWLGAWGLGLLSFVNRKTAVAVAAEAQTGEPANLVGERQARPVSDDDDCAGLYQSRVRDSLQCLGDLRIGVRRVEDDEVVRLLVAVEERGDRHLMDAADFLELRVNEIGADDGA